MSTIHILQNLPFKTALGEVCEALVMVYDASKVRSTLSCCTQQRHKDDGFEQLKHWSTFIQEFSPSINLCISNQSNYNPALFKQHDQWCRENALELVIEVPDEEDEETVGPLKERFGVERVLEALQTNMWPGMDYKTDARPSLYREYLPVRRTAGNCYIPSSTVEHVITNEVQYNETDSKPEKLTKSQEMQHAIQREKEQTKREVKQKESSKKRKPETGKVSTEELIMKGEDAQLSFKDVTEAMANKEYIDHPSTYL